MFTFIGSLFTALANIKVIGGYLEDFAAAVTMWWVQRQKTETLALVADAAALGAKAENDEERYKATDAWALALKRPRVSK